MEDTLIIQKAIEEIESKSFGTTEQLLDIHQVIYDGNIPQVLRVDKEKENGIIIVYFPIKDEKFYLSVYLETKPQILVCGVGTEPYHAVYFRVTSETLSYEQLSSLTKLKPTNGWNKGDQRKWGNYIYKVSSINFEPNPEPDEFEDKLEKLLHFLEQDKEGVLQLVDTAEGYIQVASIFHNGNTMLGGHHIDKDLMKRLAALNLEIDFDLYAEGNLFRG